MRFLSAKYAKNAFAAPVGELTDFNVNMEDWKPYVCGWSVCRNSGCRNSGCQNSGCLPDLSTYLSTYLSQKVNLNSGLSSYLDQSELKSSRLNLSQVKKWSHPLSSVHTSLPEHFADYILP